MRVHDSQAYRKIDEDSCTQVRGTCNCPDRRGRRTARRLAEGSRSGRQLRGPRREMGDV